MQDFTQLKVWQKAHSFTVNLYKMTANFPSEEKFPKGYRFAYGLTNQIWRASVSIESNLAEGCPKGYRFAYGRNGDKEFSRFIDLAQGSAYEVRCQLFIARDLGYFSVDKFELLLSKIDEISRMMIAFQKKLKAKG
ncbi:MAG: four helix bundle protein [Cyanobacteria bacterium P01_E01_bin.35]